MSGAIDGVTVGSEFQSTPLRINANFKTTVEICMFPDLFTLPPNKEGSWPAQATHLSQTTKKGLPTYPVCNDCLNESGKPANS